MRGFEEWRDKNAVSGRSHKADARVWRAALEWLRDNEDAYCCGDCDAVGDWTECPKDTVIKQELEDE
jgi:hypothetical protein